MRVFRSCGGARLLLAAGLIGALCSSVLALSPESPEVKAAIKKGLKYLETASDGHAQALGGRCLIAMAFLKNGADANHPKVKEAIDACLNAAQGDARGIAQGGMDVYSHGIAIVFLCEVDSSRFQPQIEKLLHALEMRQKGNGGWGYLHGDHAATGDTSMTQYAALATWAADRHGTAASLESVERLAIWLIRTQNPDGQWGYQGREADGNEPGRRIKQDRPAPALTAAGAGAMFICADLLGFSAAVDEEKADDGLPPALKPVKKKAAGPNAQGPLTKVVDQKLINRARLDGAHAVARAEGTVHNDWTTYYYLYALERFESFKELSEGKAQAEPGWYNVGARFLLKSQNFKGEWHSDRDTIQPSVSTAFAILFLSRGTKKSIEKTALKAGEGTLAGGRGLPSDTSNVRVRKGQVVPQQAIENMDALLKLLESGEVEKLDAEGAAEDIHLSEEPEARKGELARLRKLLTSASFEARYVVVRILGRSHDLDNAPPLIYALGDPDSRIVKLAYDGLAFLARKQDTTAFPEKPSDEQKQAARKAWRQWYLSVRPDGELWE